MTNGQKVVKVTESCALMTASPPPPPPSRCSQTYGYSTGKGRTLKGLVPKMTRYKKIGQSGSPLSLVAIILVLTKGY